MLNNIRQGSIAEARRLGYKVNEQLPIIDFKDVSKWLSEIAERLLALFAVVSSSYGYPKDRAIRWLQQEGLIDALSPLESAYLNSLTSTSRDVCNQWQVESLWALAWMAGCHEHMTFSDSCSDYLIEMLPDIKKYAPTTGFISHLRLKPRIEIVKQCDLSYCLHWAIRDAEIHGLPSPGHVPPQVVVERRRAFEWALGEDPWDEIILDT